MTKKMRLSQLLVRKGSAVGVSALLFATGLILAGPRPALASVPEVKYVKVSVSTEPGGQGVIGKWVSRESICTSGKDFDGTATASTTFSLKDTVGCRISPLVFAVYSIEIKNWPHDVFLRVHQVGPGFVTTCSDARSITTKCAYSFGHGVGTVRLTLKTNFG